MKNPDDHTLTLPGYKDKIKYVQFLHDASEIKQAKAVTTLPYYFLKET